MKVKVCGMRETNNIQDLLALQPDYIGFIFYEKSPRFVSDLLDENLLKSFPRSTKKVGVFVNASVDTILKNVKRYSLDFVQLHGDETPDFCRSLKFKGVNIIKAFAVDETFNFNKLNNYKPVCDFFLFDAKGQNRGGNGTTFDWSVLNRYDNEKPFFLAGGISADHAKSLQNLIGLKIHSIDINSQFEIAPALKDVEKINYFLQKLNPVEVEV